MAAADDATPASASMEAAASDAALRMQLRVFLFDGNEGTVDLGSLELCGSPPPPSLQAPAVVDEEADGADHLSKEAGIYMAVLEGGGIKDVARLGWEQEDEGKGLKHYLLLIRMWAESARVVLVLFDGGYCTKNQKEKLLKIMGTEVEKIDAVTASSQVTQVCSSWSKDSMSRLDFEGPLEYSEDLEKLICAELNPGMEDFRVSRILGKSDTCKVYECAYLDTPISGIQYAMKKMDLTEYYDGIDAIDNKEPRGVSTISCLKDPSVVSFHQAWAANGIYKSYIKGSSDEEGTLIYQRHRVARVSVIATIYL